MKSDCWVGEPFDCGGRLGGPFSEKMPHEPGPKDKTEPACHPGRGECFTCRGPGPLDH